MNDEELKQWALTMLEQPDHIAKLGPNDFEIQLKVSRVDENEKRISVALTLRQVGTTDEQ